MSDLKKTQLFLNPPGPDIFDTEARSEENCATRLRMAGNSKKKKLCKKGNSAPQLLKVGEIREWLGGGGGGGLTQAPLSLFAYLVTCHALYTVQIIYKTISAGEPGAYNLHGYSTSNDATI